ncbi:FecR family protein [Dyadobacter luticola]|uniref:DUF4974 domain-containing protein n=1 Tax=Dyadobacter luticola TaxID=1979387 RepID=A0A5R9KX52_9BACT|nr:FecR family protein [Dyadobacter luticola]TLV00718.1 DUF4974 domain-containing protein [Dyadobacter luticola]
MNNYKSFEVKDWLEDLRFRDWVYHGKDDAYWLNVLRDNPLQAANMEQAREILLAVKGNQDFISEAEVKLQVGEIMQAIPDENERRILYWWNGNWLRVAAVFLLMTGFATIFYKQKNITARFGNAAKSAFNDSETLTWTEIENKTTQIKLVNLPDGSSVILKKNARLRYPKHFTKEKREVELAGEAFFEVVKNPEQPFLVYAGNMVTKVKGTSFSIRANDEDDEVKLVVKTGIVEVSANDTGKKENGAEVKKLVLKPNEQVTFNRKNQTMIAKTVTTPVLLDLPVENQDFEFKRTPLADVFASLEKTYGLDIRYDKLAIAKCTITARLGDEPVSEKLDMICTVVNAKYETRNGVILVSSPGCE